MVISNAPALALEGVPSAAGGTVITLGIAARFGDTPVLVLAPLADLLLAQAGLVTSA